MNILENLNIRILDPIEELKMMLDEATSITNDAKLSLAESMLDTETVAMLQALYSRSTTSVCEHVDTEDTLALKQKLEKWYVNYGHRSIGDGGSTTIFIEGVSLLAAKAIQNHHAYAGQESSTRYINFREMGYYNETASCKNLTLPDTLNTVQEELLDIYDIVLADSKRALAEKFAKPEDVKQSVWDNTVAAKAFDIARGYLPAGVKTNLSWHSNFRQLTDHLEVLAAHPLAEVRMVAQQIHEELQSFYPYAFKDKMRTETDKYYNEHAMLFAYGTMTSLIMDGEFDPRDFPKEDNVVYTDRTYVPSTGYSELLENRPKYGRVPSALRQLGVIELHFPLDFASYRDIARHNRSMCLPNQVIFPSMGMHVWYYDSLSDEIKTDVMNKVDNILIAIDDATKRGSIEAVDAQYLIPIGCKVMVEVSTTIDALIYLLDLRSSSTVHQTLRDVISIIAQRFYLTHSGIKLHLDESTDALDARRGTQTLATEQPPEEGVEIEIGEELELKLNSDGSLDK